MPAPLVEPATALTGAQLARYSRQVSLPGFGEEAQRRLANARVLVVGAGGLGSATVPYLASAGIGTIGIVDTDVVELSNLHRQIAHGMADLGRPKTESLADAVSASNPETRVVRHDVHLDSSNIMGVLADYDLVLDGSDNFVTRYLVNDAAALAHKPLVWGAILQYSGQVGVAWAEHGPTYRDLFPVPPDPASVVNCADGGVLPSVCAAIGAIMGAETIKLITGIGRPLIGRVSVYDALDGTFREVEYERSPETEPITGLIDYEAFCGVDRDDSVGDEPVADEVDSAGLSALLQTGFRLIDVREPWESSIASIEGSELIPIGTLGRTMGEFDRDEPLVLYCHHGTRSAHALEALRRNGFTRATHLAGGIDEYARQVDPSLARY
jgi:molybdopterin/thiamine biosynthesis adenylyltransferase/rhodanese-related sulfurtransferase